MLSKRRFILRDDRKPKNSLQVPPATYFSNHRRRNINNSKLGLAEFLNRAGVPGFEPGYLVLETRVLPLDDTPTQKLFFAFFVRRVLPAKLAELLQLDRTRDQFLIFRRKIIHPLALPALQFY